MYHFRGYCKDLNKWIYGTSLVQTKNSVKIRTVKGVESCWLDVDPKTVGVRYAVVGTSPVQVYNGDIVRYTFTERKETFNKYYIVVENENGIFLEESWRDYRINPDTFEVVRCECFDFKGHRSTLNSHNTFAALKVVGNIWDNPEISKL